MSFLFLSFNSTIRSCISFVVLFLGLTGCGCGIGIGIGIGCGILLVLGIGTDSFCWF